MNLFFMRLNTQHLHKKGKIIKSTLGKKLQIIYLLAFIVHSPHKSIVETVTN